MVPGVVLRINFAELCASMARKMQRLGSKSFSCQVVATVLGFRGLGFRVWGLGTRVKKLGCTSNFRFCG